MQEDQPQFDFQDTMQSVLTAQTTAIARPFNSNPMMSATSQKNPLTSLLTTQQQQVLELDLAPRLLFRLNFPPQGSIEVYDNSDLEAVAQEFVARNGLEPADLYQQKVHAMISSAYQMHLEKQQQEGY